jgi:hypothetical protein
LGIDAIVGAPSCLIIQIDSEVVIGMRSTVMAQFDSGIAVSDVRHNPTVTIEDAVYLGHVSDVAAGSVVAKSAAPKVFSQSPRGIRRQASRQTRRSGASSPCG